MSRIILIRSAIQVDVDEATSDDRVAAQLDVHGQAWRHHGVHPFSLRTEPM
jgi:hypothetical protein